MICQSQDQQIKTDKSSATNGIYIYIYCVPHWEESNAQQNFGGPTHGPPISWRSPRHWCLGDLWHLHRFDGYDPVLQNSPQRTPTEAHDIHLIVPVCPFNDCNNLIQFLHVFAPSRPHLLYVLAALQWCSSECEELLSSSESTVLCTCSERSSSTGCACLVLLESGSFFKHKTSKQELIVQHGFFNHHSFNKILRMAHLGHSLYTPRGCKSGICWTYDSAFWICQIWLWRGHS